MFEEFGKKQAVTAAITFCVAGSAGYIMQSDVFSSAHQNAQTAQAQVGALWSAAPDVPTLPSWGGVTRGVSQPTALLSYAPQSQATRSDLSRNAPVRLASISDNIEFQPGQAPVQTAEVATCEVGFTAVASPGAMVDLTLEAPCYGGQSVDFFHAGLRFSQNLDDAGLVQISVPAMEENGVYAATFSDGRTEGVEVLMPTLENYNRTALVWEGETGFQLNALEGGATFGGPGHIRADAPGTVSRATQGEGGFMSVLGAGDGGYSSVIYTYPAQFSEITDLTISVEAEILQGTCAHTISGLFLRSDPHNAPQESELTMAVPACDTVGEFLVLNNPPQALKIARN